MSLLTPEQIEKAVQNLSGWNPTGKEIRKEFQFKDFIEAMGFVNRVAELAEEINHHPDIEIRYNRVVLVLWSHDLEGVTERDVRLAGEIEQLGG